MRRISKRVLLIISSLYMLGLVVWFLCWLLFRDANLVLFLINAVAIYLFLPLPLLPLVALWTRRPVLLVHFCLAAALWAYLWGPLFVSGSKAVTAGNAGQQSLTVMTYNVLGFNTNSGAIVEALKRSSADVIGLQELSPQNADAIHTLLADVYPYQDLRPGDGSIGMGIISRLPFTDVPHSLADHEWVGPPIVVDVPMGSDGAATVVVFHTAPITHDVDSRERQAQLLRDFAQEHGQPVVLLGDLNASSTNRAYEILDQALDDAWRAAGEGMGHTFPGASRETTPGSNRPHPFGITVPKWLVRIDYVFYSHDWRAVDAEIGPWDGGSDHRPVIAHLVLAD